MSVVVGLTGQDLVAAIELFEQHYARQLVRQRDPAERKTVVNAVEVEAERAPDHEAEVLPALAPRLQEAAEVKRIYLLAVAGQQRDEGPLRDAANHLLVFAHLDHLEPGVTREQLLIMLDVVREWWTQPAHRDNEDPHDGILRFDGRS